MQSWPYRLIKAAVMMRVMHTCLERVLTSIRPKQTYGKYLDIFMVKLDNSANFRSDTYEPLQYCVIDPSPFFFPQQPHLCAEQMTKKMAAIKKCLMWNAAEKQSTELNLQKHNSISMQHTRTSCSREHRITYCEEWLPKFSFNLIGERSVVKLSSPLTGGERF